MSVNESFTVSSALQRMMMLNRDGKRCAIFFNFTFFKVCIIYNQSLVDTC